MTLAASTKPPFERARAPSASVPASPLGTWSSGAAYSKPAARGRRSSRWSMGCRLSPFDPQNFTWLFLLSAAYTFSGNAEAGLSTACRALSVRPHWIPALKMVALCCTRLGDRQQARSAASQVRAAATEGNLARLIPSPNPAWIDEIEQAIRDALGNGRDR